MRIRYALFGAVLAALALALSCATPPPAVEPEAPMPEAPAEEVAPAPEPEVVDGGIGAPDGLRAQAAELRKEAFDLGLKDILASQYAEAEKAYALGGEKYGKDNEASTAAYEDAISLFGEVIESGLPIVASTEGDKARAAQSAAVGKGVVSYYEGAYDASVTLIIDAEGLEESGDFKTAIQDYRSASARFVALAKMCDAKVLRDDIVDRDFARYDTSNWTIAEGKLASAGDLIGSDAKASLTAADEANLRYNLVMRNALGYYADDRKLLSESERERASGIKSEVAVKDEFDEAVALYESAEIYQEAEDLESASSLYEQSAEAFTAAYDLAKAKMDAAQDELDSLDEALESAASR